MGRCLALPFFFCRQPGREIESGFSLLEEIAATDTFGKTYQSKFQLDLAGTEKILQLLSNPVETGGTCKRKNITVTVIGTPGSEVQYTGTPGGAASNLFNGMALGNHMAVHTLWELDPHDCPCQQKSQIPTTVCGNRDGEGGEQGEAGEGAGVGACVDDDPPPTPSNCADVDIGASRDTCDDTCTYYNHFPLDCGDFDDDDFVAGIVCCACSGGVAASASGTDKGVDTATVLLSVFAGALLLFVIAGGLRRWRQRAVLMAAKDFTPWLQELNLDGTLISAQPEDRCHRVVPQELGRSSVRLIKQIGSGEFGLVWQGTYTPPRDSLRRASNAFVMPVAVKELRNDPSAHEREELMREGAITAQFDHENVLGMIGVVTAGVPVLLILQFCDRGSLSSMLQDSKELIDVRTLVGFCCDAAKGMAYLAERRFVHRDL